MAKRMADVTQLSLPKTQYPYTIPDNWQWMHCRNVLRSMESTKPEGEVFEYIDIESIDNQTQIVYSPKSIPTAKAPSRARRKLHSGDTLVSMVRPYLKNIAYIDERLAHCIASTGFYVATPTEALDGRYLYWFFTSEFAVEALTREMKGDNSPSIKKHVVEELPIPIPPLAEQQRIVNHIESLFGKLDAAAELVQLEQIKSMKEGILALAFRGELGTNDPFEVLTIDV